MSATFHGPSPKLMIVLLAIGLFLLLIGEIYFSSGRGAYGLSRGALPTLFGLGLLVIDAILLVIWRVQRNKSSALELPDDSDD
jgi:hypothetical protein